MDGLLLIILAVIVAAVFANAAFLLGEDSRDDFGLPKPTLLS
jgi:hypothetical protein